MTNCFDDDFYQWKSMSHWGICKDSWGFFSQRWIMLEKLFNEHQQHHHAETTNTNVKKGRKKSIFTLQLNVYAYDEWVCVYIFIPHDIFLHFRIGKYSERGWNA